MSRPPNILLFLTDDHGAWALGCQGNSEVRSPTLDALARDGTRFTNAFTPCPVCSPARACLLTGRTPSQVGIHDWLEERDAEIANRDWLADEMTLPELLKSAGYRCGLSGKWHLGQSHRTPRGFDWCFGLPGYQGGHIETYTYHLNGEPVTLSGNKSAIITDHAIQFLDSHSSDQPFFLNVGYISTHSPYAGQDPELVRLYEHAKLSDVPDDPPHPWRKNEGFSNDPQLDPAARRRAIVNYYAAVSDIDRQIGRVLRKLEGLGLRDDTIVIYTSDHGCTLGHHGFWGKGNSTRPLNMYETSLRVPLIWNAPESVTKGLCVESCVDHYDTFQTLCDLAKVPLEANRNYPGRSYLNALRGEPLTSWSDTRFGEYGDLRMIRTPRWKLVARFPNGPDDLFDLQSDPAERTNLIGTREAASVEQALRDQLSAYYRQHEDATKSGLLVKQLPRHNLSSEAWRDGKREANRSATR